MDKIAASAVVGIVTIAVLLDQFFVRLDARRIERLKRRAGLRNRGADDQIENDANLFV
jgi:hypothetical protein